MKDILTLLAVIAAGLVAWLYIIAAAVTGQGLPTEFWQ
jgi:hypothetical protein